MVAVTERAITAPDVRPTTRAWLVLGMLAFVYVLNFLDRQLLSILAKPIQDSLHLSDSQLGRIGGLYFALFYCLISIPVGWFADKVNRTRVLSLACGLWSAATMACGLSANYPQLVASRMALLVMNLVGMGVGPTFVGAMSDVFRAAHPHNSLQLAFLCLAPFYVVAILIFLALARVLRGETTGAHA